MNLLRTFGIAMEGLALNKVRSLLTTLGVIIGVAAVTTTEYSVRPKRKKLDTL
jgi:hypothetical protein